MNVLRYVAAIVGVIEIAVVVVFVVVVVVVVVVDNVVVDNVVAVVMGRRVCLLSTCLRTLAKCQ